MLPPRAGGHLCEAGRQSKDRREAPEGLTPISRLAQKGDPIALKAFEMEGRYLGQVIAMCCSVLDPEKVILGGGVALAFDQYKEPLIRTVKQELNIRAGKTIPAVRPTGWETTEACWERRAVAVLELNHFG